VRPALVAFGGAAAFFAAVPSSAAPVASAAVVAAKGGTSVADFYVQRGGRPLWLGADGQSGAGIMLLETIKDSAADGLKPRAYKTSAIERALRDARGGSPAQLRYADRLLSDLFVTYVRDLKRTSRIAMTWVDSDLRPSSPSPFALLSGAAAAPSIEQYVADMGWMNPVYAGLRRAIAAGAGRNKAERAMLALNLERARILPATGKYVVVNSAEQRLTMYEGTRAVGSMNVVVGKPVYPTPMMAAYIRFTSLNPYWNVPSDLAAERIAPNVVSQGLPYLKEKGYQVLSGWNDKAKVVNPATIDWPAVAAGKQEIRLRQLPGPTNSMGNMKFMFPNSQGIYLHDTPQKELLTEASRMFSGGCVRLEDAPRLARWLYGKPLRAPSAKPEIKVNLPRPVPVFLTYITAVPQNGTLAYLPDLYGRDAQALRGSGKKKGLFAGL
jgi:murein L,D-transpeptidase YcbB/YkuD